MDAIASTSSSSSSSSTKRAIGIDLGTTYSCVAVWQPHGVEIIPNEQGNRTTPSCVAFSPSERLIGDAAKNQEAMNSSNTIFDAKRLIGRVFSDEAVQYDLRTRLWPFSVAPRLSSNNEKKPVFVVTHRGEQKEFEPEEISAMILTKMKEIAERYLGSIVADVVITVPAYFNNLQRQATKDAGIIAGLNILHIINEPTAAAIAYGLDKKVVGNNDERRNVLVFDLGGGTFDVSLVVMENELFEVKAVSGNTHLGGGDFDARMVEYLVSQFQRIYGINIRRNVRALGRLRAACERAKRALSSCHSVNIELDCLAEGIDFTSCITRARFDALNDDLFESCITYVDRCLKDANMESKDIDEIVLVGGSSRIPALQKLLCQRFPGKSLCSRINPDEAVAYGATAHAANIVGLGKKEYVLVDVTPLSLGIENETGNITRFIPRNTPLPARHELMFTTTEDRQRELIFYVYEGESLIAKNNNLLGRFVLSDISPAPKGEPSILTSLDINADGILNCSAIDMVSGMCSEISIACQSGRLSKEEVDRMVRDADIYQLEDDESRRKTTAFNDLDRYVSKVRSFLRSKRVRDEDRRKMENIVNQMANWLDWNCLLPDSYKFREKKKELERVCEPVMAKALQQVDDGFFTTTTTSQTIEIIEID